MLLPALQAAGYYCLLWVTIHRGMSAKIHVSTRDMHGRCPAQSLRPPILPVAVGALKYAGAGHMSSCAHIIGCEQSAFIFTFATL
jgi:hypothetical protein